VLVVPSGAPGDADDDESGDASDGGAPGDDDSLIFFGIILSGL
jgi:hypothetical protein